MALELGALTSKDEEEEGSIEGDFWSSCDLVVAEGIAEKLDFGEMGPTYSTR
jgi:hypothetical protein